MSYIYYLLDARDSFYQKIKIGVSVKPLKRWAQHRNDRHKFLYFLGLSAGDGTEEKRLHYRFRANLVPGEIEWFWPSDELYSHLANCVVLTDDAPELLNRAIFDMQLETEIRPIASRNCHIANYVVGTIGLMQTFNNDDIEKLKWFWNNDKYQDLNRKKFMPMH